MFFTVVKGHEKVLKATTKQNISVNVDYVILKAREFLYSYAANYGEPTN